MTMINWYKICTLLHCFSTLVTAELIYSAVLFRHGDRSPMGTYPKDLHSKAWRQGFAQLTQNGMRQQYALGQFLRRKYIKKHHLLNATYRRKEIQVRSTDVDRTLMSAYSNLAGLFPPNKVQTWNSAIPWQPIPVHTINRTDDHADGAFDEKLRAKNMRLHEEELAPFYRHIEQLTGVSHEDIRNIWRVYDTLVCEKAENMTLPNWVNAKWKVGNSTKTLFQLLQQQATLEFDMKYSGVKLSRLRGGLLLKTILQNMQLAVDKQLGELKMHVYSAHDDTVAAFSSALGVYNSIMPPYAACVMADLHSNTSGYYVTINYRNDSTRAEPYVLTVPGCSEACPLQSLFQLRQKHLPGDILSECQVAPWNLTTRLKIVIGCVAGGSLLVLVVTAVLCSRKRNDSVGYSSLPRS